LIGILIVHEQVLQRDAKIDKGKNSALRMSHKGKKSLSAKTYEAIDALLDNSKTNDEELSFLTNKFKKKTLTKHENYDRGHKSKDNREHRDKVIYYGCRKTRHFKIECSKMENKKKGKEEERKKERKNKRFQKKRSFMYSQKDLDSSNSDLDQAHIGLVGIVCCRSLEESNKEVDCFDI